MIMKGEKIKKYKKAAVIALFIFLLTACGKPGRPIMLPDREEVISISVSDGERTGYSPDAGEEADEFISDFLDALTNMEITNKESITDAPPNVDYITIGLKCRDKTTTLFYYEDKGTEYVEQPYQGIYKPDAALGLYITEMLDSADNAKETADAMWDRIPMVRVNGRLYYDTGRESRETGRCGTMDGEITSTVDGTEIPMEDNQSNFGSGFGYQYGKDDTIEIYMNEKWVIFEYREDNFKNSSV